MLNNAVHKYYVTIPVILSLFTISVVMDYGDFAYGETASDQFTVVTDTNLSDPLVQQILKNIEKAKQDFAESEAKQKETEEKQKIIEEQKNISKNILESDLKQMEKDFEGYTSLAAFNKFLAKIPDENVKQIYTGLFEYQQDKVKQASDALHKVLKNGGTLQEARNAYYEAAKIPRADMIQLVEDLNITTGFADSEMQQIFNENGKLPRYENETQSTENFVDLTTNSINVNSSDVMSANNNTESYNGDTSEMTIKELKGELAVLREKIKSLERQTSVVQLTNVDNSSYFAKWIIDYKQGLDHDGISVIPERSAAINVLNEPNSYDKSLSFFSLGERGEITMSFAQPVSSELVVYETSWGPTTSETASIEVSIDNKNWIPLSKMSYYNQNPNVHEFIYDLHDVGCIQYVKITDTTPTSLPGDGFDVDAVGSTKTCTGTT